MFYLRGNNAADLYAPTVVVGAISTKGVIMAKRTSIYLPVHTQAVLKSYGEGSTSGTITGLIDRYQTITADAMPSLTEAEWSLICDALNGCGVWISTGGPDPFLMLWAEIYDSEQDGLGEKWGVDVQALARRLRELPLAGRAAVWDVAARFWAHPKLDKLETREILLAVGAKITDADG